MSHCSLDYSHLLFANYAVSTNKRKHEFAMPMPSMWIVFWKSAFHAYTVTPFQVNRPWDRFYVVHLGRWSVQRRQEYLQRRSFGTEIRQSLREVLLYIYIYIYMHIYSSFPKHDLLRVFICEKLFWNGAYFVLEKSSSVITDDDTVPCDIRHTLHISLLRIPTPRKRKHRD